MGYKSWGQELFNFLTDCRTFPIQIITSAQNFNFAPELPQKWGIFSPKFCKKLGLKISIQFHFAPKFPQNGDFQSQILYFFKDYFRQHKHFPRS